MGSLSVSNRKSLGLPDKVFELKNRCCDRGHKFIYQCGKFKNLSQSSKLNFLKLNRLCENYLLRHDSACRFSNRHTCVQQNKDKLHNALIFPDRSSSSIIGAITIVEDISEPSLLDVVTICEELEVDFHDLYESMTEADIEDEVCYDLDYSETEDEGTAVGAVNFTYNSFDWAEEVTSVLGGLNFVYRSYEWATLICGSDSDDSDDDSVNDNVSLLSSTLGTDEISLSSPPKSPGWDDLDSSIERIDLDNDLDSSTERIDLDNSSLNERDEDNDFDSVFSSSPPTTPFPVLYDYSSDTSSNGDT